MYLLLGQFLDGTLHSLVIYGYIILSTLMEEPANSPYYPISQYSLYSWVLTGLMASQLDAIFPSFLCTSVWPWVQILNSRMWPKITHATSPLRTSNTLFVLYLYSVSLPESKNAMWWWASHAEEHHHLVFSKNINITWEIIRNALFWGPIQMYGFRNYGTEAQKALVLKNLIVL